jgi:hypothetical protein
MLLKGVGAVVATKVELVVVPPDSELSQTLKAAQASGNPVVVDTGEARYTLLVAMTEPAPDLFAGYDAHAAIEGLRALHETLSGVDREALLRDLRAQREHDPVPALLAAAAVDDEPLSDDDRRHIAEGRQAYREGRFVSAEEVRQALRDASSDAAQTGTN